MAFSIERMRSANHRVAEESLPQLRTRFLQSLHLVLKERERIRNLEFDLRKERQTIATEKLRHRNRFEREMKFIKDEKQKLRREATQLKMEKDQMAREKEEVNRSALKSNSL